MTLVKTHSPFAKSFDGLMNEIFNELPTSFGKALREDVLHFPPVNITENAGGYDVKLSAPGFEKGDFSIKLDANILTISAEKKEESTETTEKTIRKEFSLKSFKRSFTVDEKIDATNIAAKYENGILAVTLPKKEEVKTAAKEITIA
jgi:HSP20 family protein